MEDHFFEQIFKNPKEQPNIPPNEIVSLWAEKLIQVLFPENAPKVFSSVKEVKEHISVLELELYDIISASCKLKNSECKNAAGQFFDELPELYRV
jgi:serine O-acetyltransferase